MSKQYGLILPNKGKKTPLGTVVRPSIFNDDSDSDTPTVSKPVVYGIVRKQDKIDQQRAIEEDPTVYQYDEIYDEMAQKKVQSKLARKDIDKKPKYISKLLAAADRRKRENEKRIEKQVQKEREAEGETFKDKESFVTSAYKKKLEELKTLEEQERREEYLESIGDVRKQGNLDGFYRHLYDQKINYEDRIKQENESSKEIKQEVDSDEQSKEQSNAPGPSKDASGSDDNETIRNTKSKKRKYRSRKRPDLQSQSESEEEKVEVKKEHLPSNLDADSDFSIDSSSESDKEGKNTNDKKSDQKDGNIEHEGEKLKLPEKGNVLSDNAALAKKNDHKDDKESSEKVDTKEDDDIKDEIKEPPKPKIDIWKKRTVGEAYDEAVKRYFQRKAARDAIECV